MSENKNQNQAVVVKRVSLEMLDGERFKKEVLAALPKHIGPDRFVRIVRTCVRKNPKLLECEPESFWLALLNLAALGLEPDGRRAHLIPRKNSKKNIVECQYQLDYKGKVELALRSGTVSNIHADIVCDLDEFEYDTGEVKRHRIDFRKERGEVYAVYCIVTFKDGSKKADCMSTFDVERIRKRSQQPDGIWASDWDEMAKKTVFHRLSKWIELSPEYRDAIEHDADYTDERMIPAKPNFKPATTVSFPETPAATTGTIPESGFARPDDDKQKPSPEGFAVRENELFGAPLAPAVPEASDNDGGEPIPEMEYLNLPVPIRAHAGKLFRNIPNEELNWFIQSWSPNPKRQPQMQIRAALDEAGAALGLSVPPPVGIDNLH